MLENNSHRIDNEEVFQGESLHAPLKGPNAGSESVMVVRGADMWAFGREERPVAAEIQRGNKGEGRRAALSAS